MNLIPVCPRCGTEGNVVELDVVPARAKIASISAETGAIYWLGESEIDWDEQRPANVAHPKFGCRNCGQVFSQKVLLAATKKANKEA